MVFVLVSRSRRVVPDELVTLTSWDARDFLIFLVMVGWKGKDAVKDGVVAFSCLLNCLSNSLLGFSSFCLTLSMMRLTLSGSSSLSLEYGRAGFMVIFIIFTSSCFHYAMRGNMVEVVYFAQFDK